MLDDGDPRALDRHIGKAVHALTAACVAGPEELPSDKATCTDDGQLALCKANSSVTLSSCPGTPTASTAPASPGRTPR